MSMIPGCVAATKCQLRGGQPQACIRENIKRKLGIVWVGYNTIILKNCTEQNCVPMVEGRVFELLTTIVNALLCLPSSPETY